MKFHILTLFPELLEGFFSGALLKKAQDNNICAIELTNIRDFSEDKHRRVDDTLYGGGSGMLMQPEPVAKSIEYAKEKSPKARVISLSPSGETLTQSKAQSLAENKEDLIILCGRYEGIDHRVRATMVDEEISIGDYVLNGGESAATVLVEAVARLLPGMMGDQNSAVMESHSPALFGQREFPQFTRPRVWRDLSVPSVLVEGDHKKILDWQMSHIPGLSEEEETMIRVRLKSLPQKSKHLIYRLPAESDIDLWMNWVNDPKVTEKLILDPPFTREDEEGFFEMSMTNLGILPFTICEKENDRPIATAALTRDDFNPLSADYGILIGEKDCWGKGYGTEMTQKILHIGFEELGLTRIHLRVFVENIAAQRVYEKCGFQKIGVAKKAILKSDGYHDCLLYEKVKKD